MSNTAAPTTIASLLKPRLSLKTQTIATIGAVVAAVVLPTIFHYIGMISGSGTAPGRVFLPMHLPVILVGLLAGPYAGLVTGILAPLVSFAISGMPPLPVLPQMVFELAFYGLVAGLLCNFKMPSFFKVLISQIAGRLAVVLYLLVGIYLFSKDGSVMSVWGSVVKGLPGLIIQWVSLPLLAFWITHLSDKEKKASGK